MRTAGHRWKEVLRHTFGVPAFRPGQKRAVTALLSGRDVLGIFPTGAGKSLCFQLPAVMLPGMTLVVSPLISLMWDQVQSLRSRGIAAGSLDSLQNVREKAELEREIADGRIRLLYVSPERLQSSYFLRLIEKTEISMVVIDEAHCVVQWGNEFRPAYAEIGDFIRSLPRRPVICAMTATADREMQKQLIRELEMVSPRKVSVSLVRDNLRYRMITTIHPEWEILRIIHQHEGEKGLIFCRSRAQTEWIAGQLSREGIRADFYHAGMDREQRMRRQEEFRSGVINVLAATSAFGMGVDIPDIRYLIHQSVPENMTDYAQQAGRAGRDGAAAECIVLLDPAALHRVHLMLIRERRQVKFRLSRYLKWRSNCREYEQVLRVLLNGKCISSGITAHFGERSRSCGKCSACLRKETKQGNKRIADVPSMRTRAAASIPVWALRWECSVMHDAGMAVPDRSQLQRAAKNGYLAEANSGDPMVRKKLTELLEHMR